MGRAQVVYYTHVASADEFKNKFFSAIVKTAARGAAVLREILYLSSR